MHECQDSFSAFPYERKDFPLLKHIVNRGIVSPMNGISKWKFEDESTMVSSGDSSSSSGDSSSSSGDSSSSSDSEMSDGDDVDSDDLSSRCSSTSNSGSDHENSDDLIDDYSPVFLGCTGCNAAPWTGAVALKTSGMIEVSTHVENQHKTYSININAPPDVLAMVPDNFEREITTMQEIVEKNMGSNGTIYVCGLAMDFCGKLYFLNCQHFCENIFLTLFLIVCDTVQDTCANAKRLNSCKNVSVVLDCTRAAYLPQPPNYKQFDFQTQPSKVLQKFIEDGIQISYIRSILMNWDENTYQGRKRPLEFLAGGGYKSNDIQ